MVATRRYEASRKGRYWWRAYSEYKKNSSRRGEVARVLPARFRGVKNSLPLFTGASALITPRLREHKGTRANALFIGSIESSPRGGPSRLMIHSTANEAIMGDMDPRGSWGSLRPNFMVMRFKINWLCGVPGSGRFFQRKPLWTGFSFFFFSLKEWMYEQISIQDFQSLLQFIKIWFYNEWAVFRYLDWSD